MRDESFASPVVREIDTEKTDTNEDETEGIGAKEIDVQNIFAKLLGTNWLSKIGIVTLVLGIGFFVKYAIDQEWINEVERITCKILCLSISCEEKTFYHKPLFLKVPLVAQMEHSQTIPLFPYFTCKF